MIFFSLFLQLMHVEGLKNRLEALASPELVASFNANNVEKSRFFVKAFKDMGRSPQLLKYYRKCLRARLLRLWSDVVREGDEGSFLTNDAAGPSSVLEWSRKFFSIVSATLKEQVNILEKL